MNILFGIILAIIKKNFLFFKPFGEKFGSLAELNHKYKGQKTGTTRTSNYICSIPENFASSIVSDLLNTPKIFKICFVMIKHYLFYKIDF